MGSDRRWMWNRFDSHGGLRAEFVEGVKSFLDFAEANSLNDDDDESGVEIKCPCTTCRNTKYLGVEDVKEHIYRRGFIKDYTVWTFHGECNGGVSSEDRTPEPRCDNPNPYVQMVFDAVGPDLNGSQVDTNDSDSHDEMSSSFDAAKFYSLLSEAQTPLYNGCDEHNVLSLICNLLKQKSDGQVSVRVFDEQIRYMKSLLPKDNKVPKNFYECKKKLAKLGLRYQKIDSCVNNCMLYYGDDQHLIECPKCHTSRYKVAPSKGKKGIPHRVLRYLPIIPRLQRLYMSAKTAPHMTWHQRNRSADGSMAHPSDSKAWKEFNRIHEEFASDARNVRLGLCTDGFTPFNHYGGAYSCWPVILTVYNLPPWMCMKEQYMFLNMVIPGPSHPGKDIDVFLRPLIDELKTLWSTGVTTFDASRRVHFRMRAALLWTISDLPAYAMLSGWSTHGKLACPYCMENTKAIYLTNGRKCSHFDCHRKFLPIPHPFREDQDNFRKGITVHETPPPILTGDEMLDRVSRLPDIKFGKMEKDEKIDGFGEIHNWKKKSVFWELPYWSTLLVRHNLDVMHVEKNVFENLFNTVMDVTGKTKDNSNAREDLAILCNRPDFEMREDRKGKKFKPLAPYVLSKVKQKKVYKWLKELKLPDGYSSNISRCVSSDQDKCTGLKSHDCHVMMQVLLPIALRDLLPQGVWEVIIELSSFFKDICARVVNVARIKELRVQIVETMCKLEKLFPPAFFDISEHLLVHLPYESEIGGPVQYRWMYPFERFLHGLKLKVRNKAHVEASICEAYIVQETATFCSLYFDTELTSRVNRASRNDDGGPVEDESKLSTFRHRNREFGRTKSPLLVPSQLLEVAHTYVLLNTPELTPFVRKFDDWIVSKTPHITNEELENRRVTCFASWLHQHVSNEQTLVDDWIREIGLRPCRFVRRYNGCFSKGFTFHTAAYGRDRSRSNYGVCVKGACEGGVQSYYYGTLQEIWELRYGGGCGSILLFRCDWYDSTCKVRVHERSGIVELDPRSRYPTNEPFVLASQVVQVGYMTYPGPKAERKDWWAVIKGKASSTYDLPSWVDEPPENDGDDSTFQADEMEGRISLDPNLADPQMGRMLASTADAEEVDPENIGMPSPTHEEDIDSSPLDIDSYINELDGYTDDEEDDPDYDVHNFT